MLNEVINMGSSIYTFFHTSDRVYARLGKSRGYVFDITYHP